MNNLTQSDTGTARDLADAPERYEPERYELEEEPLPHPLPLRADLFRLYGAGIVIMVAALPPPPDTHGFDAHLHSDVWLHMGEDSRVTVCTGKAEVGQNLRTSLTQAVADELPVPPASIRLVLGDTDLTPFDMGTFGSRTTPIMAPQVRRAAAAVREMLLGLAAERWGFNRRSLSVEGELTAEGELIAKKGAIHEASTGRALSFALLLQGRKLVQIVGPDAAVTPPAEWKIAGTSLPKVDGRAFVTGRHHFTSDLTAPGTLYGRVLRPPAFGARLKTVEIGAAQALPGVTVVHDDGFVGVAAPTPARANLALAAITAEWDMPSLPAGQDLVTLLCPALAPALAASEDNAAQEESGKYRLRATYTLAYIAHVPLEPRAALAAWKDGKLTVWTGTQRPFGVREELAVALGIPEGDVRVIVPDTGSGYGGKHTGDAAVEAARLAKAAACPVKIAWTREEEFTAAYLRPAGVIDVCAATEEDGTLAQWEVHNYNSGTSGISSPYEVRAQVAEFHEVPSPLRQGSYRALAATGNHFARESHMDDLAHAHGMDSLAFRLHHLKDDRLRAVLTAAAERFGWESRRAVPGHGFGIACGTEKGSYIANCVEVVALPSTGKVELLRITAAFECGAIINPSHLENQVEGAIVMGIGGALFEAIQFDRGRILNPRLSEYRVPRFGDVPPIEVVLLNRTDLPSAGAGETPIVAIAPAIGNAIFGATGIRLRTLPLVPGGLNFDPGLGIEKEKQQY